MTNISWYSEDESIEPPWPSMTNMTYEFTENDTLYEDFDSLYDVPVGIIFLLSICYGSISVLAVVGNSLVMWIIATSRRMQSVTNSFIANLALADIVIGLFVIPFQFQAALLQRWNLPHFMCAFCPFVQVLCVNVSVFTLTAIAVDRHRAILNPLSARPSKLRAKTIIAGIWLLSAILAAPMAAALRVIDVPENIGGRIHLKPFCQNENLSEKSMLIYRALLGFLQYLTPLSIISCVYTRMAFRLWGNKTPGNAQDSRDANLMKNKKKVIKMLVIVVALFAICWLPLQTYNVFQYTYPEINEYRYINIIWFCFDWLAMSNSCYNPFIYGIYNEKFKREFQQRFPFKTKNWTPNNPIDTDKTQSTRTSFKYILRYDWRKTTSRSYTQGAPLCRSVSLRDSSRIHTQERNSNININNAQSNQRNIHQTSTDNETYASELYVYSSNKHQHVQNRNGHEEL
ncbi:RYamide receptor-like [Chelonus insularis]|uniref:RYamide receptor-like n=1 Tax=Chelonus insularis TaxID=460826 RepID=UPI00158AD5D6|nr:RYamide receptor-like [Chelonus insularis]XP_034945759.1 RYamide receptor-like [Chelonus insularis]XP_034945760.1 RYamide receptor-like [Chelonus insularis]XP_034945761.1 RYamide receptor-like [Chelonus insularis]XP_034945762.1 RYamide receptor-like [Chelonus insularis]XP_034945763.1 RYamide receptor-like [Chelonus insularis]XP_034945764.1 RYamide receptor-like [Chelonus insularis]XP_034945765.1 RYamide receptor-like [Chelonus insularis]XP_034945766.1 RYamide receptor-like [Chelonus insu